MSEEERATLKKRGVRAVLWRRDAAQPLGRTAANAVAKAGPSREPRSHTRRSLKALLWMSGLGRFTASVGLMMCRSDRDRPRDGHASPHGRRIGEQHMPVYVDYETPADLAERSLEARGRPRHRYREERNQRDHEGRRARQRRPRHRRRGRLSRRDRDAPPRACRGEGHPGRLRRHAG